MILPLRYFGDPVIKEKARRLEKIEKPTRRLAKDMAETMYDAAGIGLAAPQVGIPKRLIVVDMGDNDFVAYVNPEIIKYSRREDVDEEGCLCLPEIKVPVKRAKKVVFRALDLQGRPVEMEAEDLLARILQHEVDHLEGRTILDRTTSEDKQKAIRSLMELFDQLRTGK